jgi:hypothetical protein
MISPTRGSTQIPRSARPLRKRLIPLKRKSDPSRIKKGESRPDGERIIFFAPVAVLFRIEDQEQSVIIEQAWLFSTR